jgi:hypothetical protein
LAPQSEEELRLFLVLAFGGYGGYRIGFSGYMHAGHELVTPPEGKFHPIPADVQGALAAPPMGINPATFPLGDHLCALCDQRQGRDGPYTTQMLSGFRRPELRLLQLKAMGLLIQEVLFDRVKNIPALARCFLRCEGTGLSIPFKHDGRECQFRVGTLRHPSALHAAVSRAHELRGLLRGGVQGGQHLHHAGEQLVQAVEMARLARHHMFNPADELPSPHRCLGGELDHEGELGWQWGACATRLLH